MSRLFDKTVHYLPNGPLMSELSKPQLMLVRNQRSTFLKNKQMNDKIKREDFKRFKSKGCVQ